MKKYVAILLFGLSVGSLKAQNINYEVLSNDPPSPKLNINLEWFNIDLPFRNLDGMSFNIGSYGFYQPNEQLGISYHIKKSVLGLGKLSYTEYPGNFELETGAYYLLSNTQKSKQTKVTLNREYKGSEYTRNVSGDLIERRTEEETYIVIPSNVRQYKGLRAGYYMKSGPMNYETLVDAEIGTELPYREMSLSSIGVYAGVFSRSIKSIFISTDQYGVQYNSIGDDWMLDVLIVPVNTFKDLRDNNTNVTSEVKDETSGFPLGFRLGWKRYQTDPKAKTGKRLGLGSSMELGYKPYLGFYISAGLAVNLLRR